MSSLIDHTNQIPTCWKLLCLVKKHAFDIPLIVFDFDIAEKLFVKVLKRESKFVYIRYGGTV